MMPLAAWIGLAVVLAIAGILYVRWDYARWNRKHPGQNDYMARLDNELTQIGE